MKHHGLRDLKTKENKLSCFIEVTQKSNKRSMARNHHNGNKKGKVKRHTTCKNQKKMERANPSHGSKLFHPRPL
jgi:hypothetical protein